MGYQTDFLPIGKGKCGDSFIVRFGNLTSGNPDDYSVVLIDGGYKDDWQKVRDSMNTHYGHTRIDLAISTHPDGDHINGLIGVVEQLDVRELWLHQPWLHLEALEEARQASFNSARLSEKIQNSLKSSQNLADMALLRVKFINEPFAGETKFTSRHGTVTVVGPSRDYYDALLPQFFDWKPVHVNVSSSLFDRVKRTAANALESLDVETLTNSGTTSPANQSSVITLIECGDDKLLFTGDAGVEALELAATELEFLGHAAGSYRMVQVPHHGSRKNIGPDILTRLLGDKVKDELSRRGAAYVSAAKECIDHPEKVAMNAFRRRGYHVFSTEGNHHTNSKDAPDRGWGDAMPHPLYPEVEGDD